jgi:hypothetical protein
MEFFWILVWIACCIWGATDASSRGKSGCLVLLLFLFLGPVGVIIWLLIRPEKVDY